AHVPLVGDAKSVMQQMLELLSSDLTPASAERLSGWGRQIEEWRQFAPLTYENSDEVIKPQLLCEELHRLTGGEAIIATDVGQHQMCVGQYYGLQVPSE